LTKFKGVMDYLVNPIQFNLVANKQGRNNGLDFQKKL